MPSRKKAKGKARKEAKKAEAKEEGSRAVGMAASQRQVEEEKLEERMERASINDPSPTLCRHGYPKLSSDEENICREFIKAFIITAISQANVGEGFCTATKATAEKYPDVYASKLDTVISIICEKGTQCILKGDNRHAKVLASIVRYFEEFMAIGVHMTRAVPSLSKVHELLDADNHTLVSYYRNRIPCTCLDEKYKEVKSVKKMGRCYNRNCSHPDRKVERSKMFSCSRCGLVNYCSVECQKAHWKEHKEVCSRAVKKAAFNSSQT